MSNQYRKINRDQAGLLVVDVQERLLPAMCQPNLVVQNTARLIRGAHVLGLPLAITEQYRKGLGPTLAELAEAIQGFAPIEKLSFSACGAPDLERWLQDRGVRDVLLCGIEAHVCVTQSCLDLLAQGRHVFVIADAISSRSPENVQWGIGRMRDAGASILSTEMALFEMLGHAGTDAFKKIQSLVK